MTNRPVNFNDPTGHAQSSDDQIKDSDGWCDDNDKGCNDIAAKIMKKRDTLDVFDLTEKGYFRSWEGEKNIARDNWNDLLSDIRDDVHFSWRTYMPIKATYYDTPFYNDRGNLSGRGCLGVKCYDRSELNYVAQGELWAAAGVSIEEGHKIVKFWKEKYCAWTCERNDLQEEYELFDIGYRHYQELYPPQPTTPYDIPGIFPPPNEGPNT